MKAKIILTVTVPKEYQDGLGIKMDEFKTAIEKKLWMREPSFLDAWITEIKQISSVQSK
jgi:hypothetical protein